ncbi:MAG TPA: hypothetical protein VJ873_06310 [bacterium]|nr:hypothetical protein [bacterium]
MKNFSLPRLALVLWFFFYSFYSLTSYVIGSGRHEIMPFIVIALVLTAVALICFGWIEGTSKN